MLSELPLHTLRDRILLLRSLPSFRPLDDEALTLVAEHARSRAFRAGEAVLVEGEPVSECHIVVEGQVTSTRNGKRVAVVDPGSGVGFLSIMAREPGTNAVADVPTTTLAVPAEAIVNALEESFSFVRNTLRISAATLVRKRGNLPASPDRPPPVDLGEAPERPRTMVELLLDLRRGGIFRECNIDALVDVARATREIRAEPGEVFWKIGEPSTSWRRIYAGRVRCTSADGRSVDIGKSFVLGIMDALGQVPRSYEARAEAPILAYQSELEAFLAVLETHFELARDLIAVVSKAVLDTPDAAAEPPR